MGPWAPRRWRPSRLPGRPRRKRNWKPPTTISSGRSRETDSGVVLLKRYTGAALAVSIIVVALGGCETAVEETAGLGGCWVLDGSQDVLVLLSKDGDVGAVVDNFGDADCMTAEAETATLR